jgi:hypothetical protein
MKTSNLEIFYLMNLSSSSTPLIPGTETFSSTFKHNIFNPTSLVKSDNAFITTLAVTSSSTTPYIAMASTPSFGDV